MVFEIDELSMNLVELSSDYIVPIVAELAVTEAVNLSGFQPFIESFALLVAVVMFGTFTIDIVRGGLIETIESHWVQAP